MPTFKNILDDVVKDIGRLEIEELDNNLDFLRHEVKLSVVHLLDSTHELDRDKRLQMVDIAATELRTKIILLETLKKTLEL